VPEWIKPQLTKLVDEPPEGSEWLHEIKFDGYRMHARLRGAVRLLTRTGLDWTHKYPGDRGGRGLSCGAPQRALGDHHDAKAAHSAAPHDPLDITQQAPVFRWRIVFGLARGRGPAPA